MAYHSYVQYLIYVALVDVWGLSKDINAGLTQTWAVKKMIATASDQRNMVYADPICQWHDIILLYTCSSQFLNIVEPRYSPDGRSNTVMNCNSGLNLLPLFPHLVHYFVTMQWQLLNEVKIYVTIASLIISRNLRTSASSYWTDQCTLVLFSLIPRSSHCAVQKLDAEKAWELG